MSAFAAFRPKGELCLVHLVPDTALRADDDSEFRLQGLIRRRFRTLILKYCVRFGATGVRPFFRSIRKYCPDEIDIPGIVFNYFNTHAAFYQASDQISDPALQYYI